MRDLDLHHQIGRSPFDEGEGGCISFGAGRVEASGALADVERAVGLHPGAGRLAPPAKPGAADTLHGAGDGAPRSLHDVVENPGQVFMGERGRHQGDDPAHGVEADPAEAPVPVDGGELGDGAGVGAQDVDGGAEGAGVHGGGGAHGGCPGGKRTPVMICLPPHRGGPAAPRPFHAAESVRAREPGSVESERRLTRTS